MSQIKPLVLVIKKLLYANQLHDTYTGGLGSYAVFLLVVAFLQVILSLYSPLRLIKNQITVWDYYCFTF